MKKKKIHVFQTCDDERIPFLIEIVAPTEILATFKLFEDCGCDEIYDIELAEKTGEYIFYSFNQRESISNFGDEFYIDFSIDGGYTWKPFEKYEHFDDKFLEEHMKKHGWEWYHTRNGDYVLTKEDEYDPYKYVGLKNK
jgi:hypothetical protein